MFNIWLHRLLVFCHAGIYYPGSAKREILRFKQKKTGYPQSIIKLLLSLEATIKKITFNYRS